MPPMRRYKFVSPGYFATMGNHILYGRDTNWTDVRNARHSGGLGELRPQIRKDPAKALGKRVRKTPKSPWREIIGVAGDERDDNMAAPVTVFLPALIRNSGTRGLRASSASSAADASARRPAERHPGGCLGRQPRPAHGQRPQPR